MAEARRKKWPHYAEWARLDAIAAATEAREILQQAKRELLEGNKLLAMALMADAQLELSKIIEMLNAAKGGRE